MFKTEGFDLFLDPRKEIHSIAHEIVDDIEHPLLQSSIGIEMI
jgi:hypothetical protein